MTKPVTGQTTFGASTSGTTTQLDNNFQLAYAALNDLNTYPNSLTDTGSTNAYSATLPASLTGALTDGLWVDLLVVSANTGASTFAYNGGAALQILRLDGTAVQQGDIPANTRIRLVYRASDTTWLLQTPYGTATMGVQLPIRQAVLGGPVDANGFPTVIPTSCTSLSLATSNITSTAPFVVTAANGYGSQGGVNRVGQTTANLTWANLTANAVNYLGVVVNANQTLTPTFTTVLPVDQFGGTYTTGNGNYTFNIQEMTMKAGNGNAAIQTFTVFVGEANCNANAVVTAASYAYLGLYDTGPNSNTAVNTAYTFNHNLGTTFAVPKHYARCVSNANGYIVGDTIYGPLSPTGTFAVPLEATLTRNVVSFATPEGSAGIIVSVIPKGGGAAVNSVNASWKYGIKVKRDY